MEGESVHRDSNVRKAGTLSEMGSTGGITGRMTSLDIVTPGGGTEGPGQLGGFQSMPPQLYQQRGRFGRASGGNNSPSNLETDQIASRLQRVSFSDDVIAPGSRGMRTNSSAVRFHDC